MKIKILQQDLLPVLQSVSRSCGVKSDLPVLANVLLRTELGILKLSATNLEIGVIKSVRAQILEDGEVTVPSRTFLEVISSLTGAELEIEASTDQLKITSNNFNASFNGISASEFPAIPLSSDKTVSLDYKVLQSAIPEITYAAAADEGRPILTGILTEIKKDSLELVATDGFRLAHKNVKIEGSGVSIRALVPRRTFEEIVRLISEEDKEDGSKVEISLAENQNQMVFKVGSTLLSTRLIEGQFPAWEKIVPTKFECKVTADRADLHKAVKLAAVFARSEANIIKISTLSGKLRLNSEAKELGGQESEIEAETEGADLVVAFNGKFLLDVLASMQANKISIEFSGNLSPALVKPIGEDGLEAVVMPIRLS